MRAVHTRFVIVLDAAALGAIAAAFVVAIGLPLAARRALGPYLVLVIGAGVGIAVTLAGIALLLRSVGRPVERMLSAADALGSGRAGELPLLAPPGEPALRGLSGAAIAFERMAAALVAERRRLAEKVSELERANRDLADARESWLRSERLATVGRLAAGVAHEVGNPLGAIAGYADLARDRILAGNGAEAADFLDRIGAEARRIDTIVLDLLDLARPARLDLAPVALPMVIEDALRLARVQERFRGVEVLLEVGLEVPPVIADARRLAQVFLNVFLNAGDAMGGKGAVRVAASHDPGARSVEVRIADQGKGIAPEDLPRLFDPFFTTKAPGQGTGLGLAVCHAAMESFGGSIAAEPGAQGGAVFKLTLRAA